MRIYDTIVARRPIPRGWSADRKYRAVAADGTVYFLRISPMKQYENRRLQFSHIEKVRDLGVRVCEPVELGTCPEGCYQLLGWVEGRDAEEVLPELTGEQRYALGLEAGQMLRTIHSLSPPIEAAPWAERFGRKMDKKAAAYEKCPLKYEKDSLYLELLRRERGWIATRTWSLNSAHIHILEKLGFALVKRLVDHRGPGIDTVYYGKENG